MTGTVGIAQKISLNNRYCATPLICTEGMGNLPSHIETVSVVGLEKEDDYSIPTQLGKDLVLVLKRTVTAYHVLGRKT